MFKKIFFILLAIIFANILYSDPYLDLQVDGSYQDTSVIHYRFKIINYSSYPIAVTCVAVKSWITADGLSLTFVSYASNVTVYDSSDNYVDGLPAFYADIQNVSSGSCGTVNGIDRNYDSSIFVYMPVDATSDSLPANGGYMEADGDNNTFVDIRNTAWSNFDETNDFSSTEDSNISSGYSQYRYFALYYWNGNQWIHVCEVTDTSGTEDTESGYEPCTSSACSAATPVPTDTATDTYTPTYTYTATPTATDTFTETYTNTATFTDTPTNTFTETETFTDTDTPTITPTPTDTFTGTLPPTDTPTDTATDTPTETDTFTITDTPTDTYTPTNTATFTPTFTPTFGYELIYSKDDTVKIGITYYSNAAYYIYLNGYEYERKIASDLDRQTPDFATFWLKGLKPLEPYSLYIEAYGITNTAAHGTTKEVKSIGSYDIYDYESSLGNILYYDDCKYSDTITAYTMNSLTPAPGAPSIYVIGITISSPDAARYEFYLYHSGAYNKFLGAATGQAVNYKFDTPIWLEGYLDYIQVKLVDGIGTTRCSTIEYLQY